MVIIENVKLKNDTVYLSYEDWIDDEPIIKVFSSMDKTKEYLKEVLKTVYQNDFLNCGEENQEWLDEKKENIEKDGAFYYEDVLYATIKERKVY